MPPQPTIMRERFDEDRRHESPERLAADAANSVGSLSPFGERAGVRGLPIDRETIPPHPTPLPRKSGLPDLRDLKRDPGKPGARGRGSPTASAAKPPTKNW